MIISLFLTYAENLKWIDEKNDEVMNKSWGVKRKKEKNKE